MIPYVGCDAAYEMLQPFVDGELPMPEQVALESHLRWCRTCGARVEDLRIIGASLRLGSLIPGTTEIEGGALAAIQAEVLTRIRTERDESFGVRFRALFDDMHFLWPALGASAAVIICLLGVMVVNSAARAVDPDSMADRIEGMLANPGSDRNPVQLDSWMLAPSIDAPNLGAIPEDDATFALAAVVTREGRVANYELLQSDDFGVRRGSRPTRGADQLLELVTRSRFTPAQTRAGGPVAVNVVWVVARTTVKAPMRAFDEGSLSPLRAPEDVAKPINDAPEPRVLRPARS